MYGPLPRSSDVLDGTVSQPTVVNQLRRRIMSKWRPSRQWRSQSFEEGGCWTLKPPAAYATASRVSRTTRAPPQNKRERGAGISASRLSDWSVSKNRTGFSAYRSARIQNGGATLDGTPGESRTPSGPPLPRESENRYSAADVRLPSINFDRLCRHHF